jgi:Protein of unknown function (DUF3460)
MARYESEITQFLRELKNARPEIAAQQRESRAIWWDKQLDAEQQRGYAASRVRQQPYVYATKSE